MREIVSSPNAPAAIGPYSQAVKYNGLIFVSGQLPINESGNLSEGTITEQTNIVMNNISAILKAGGSDLSKIIKSTIFVTDLSVFNEVNEAYGKFFEKEPPARACFQVAGLPKNAQLEIEVICAV